MTAFLLAISIAALGVVGAIIVLAWPVAELMREADRGGWFNE